MMVKLVHSIYLVSILSFPQLALGQSDTLCYRYWSLEESFELFLLPNHRYLYAIDGGGILIREYGNWTTDSNKIVLYADYLNQYPDIPHESVETDTTYTTVTTKSKKGLYFPNKFYLNLTHHFKMNNYYVKNSKLISKPD